MDRGRFDNLAKVVWRNTSRRTAVAMALGAVLLGRAPVSIAAKSKRKKRKRKTRACFPGKTCIPGTGRDNSGCDFARGVAFFEKDVRGSNLSHANFTDAQLAGANFQGADLGGACLVGANLLYATIDNSTNLKGAVSCNTLMPDGSLNDQDCGHGTRCCPAPIPGEDVGSPEACIGAPNAQCSLSIPYGGCCPGLRCVISSTNPVRTTCQAPCGDDRVCHRFGAAWHCAHEPVTCRYIGGECCQHV